MAVEFLDFEYQLTADFRKIFGISYYSVKSYREKLSLIISLSKNTNSEYFAAKNSWEWPATREELALLNVIDILVGTNWNPKNGKAPQQPRPYSTEEKLDSKIMPLYKALRVYVRKESKLTQEEIIERNKAFIEKKKKV